MTADASAPGARNSAPGTLHPETLSSPATLAAAMAALRRAEPGEQVLLILPAAADEFANAVNLQRLRGQADAWQVQVGLVTSDRDIRHFSRSARIPVFDSPAAGGGRWRYPRAAGRLPDPEVLRPVVLRPPLQVGLGLAAPELVTTQGATVLRGHMARRRQRAWLSGLGYVALILALAALLAGAAVLLLPQATVTLVPARTRFVSSLAVTAQTGIDAPDYLNLSVPARSVQAWVEGSGTTATTGQEEAPVGKATGRLVFLNRTAREITVPQGTIVRTTTGQNVRFRTMAEAVVPAGADQRIVVPIEAVDPGRQGNTPAFTINEIEGPLNLSLRASNEAATAGGTVDSVPTVNQADKDRLLGEMQAKLQQQAYSQLAAGLRQGEFIPPETVQTFTLAETYDRFAGEHAPELTLQLQLLARGTAVDVEELASWQIAPYAILFQQTITCLRVVFVSANPPLPVLQTTPSI